VDPRTTTRWCSCLQNHSRVVDDVVQVQQLVSELTTVTGVLRTGGIVLLVLVGFVVLFIIVNTIRLAVVARREEIENHAAVGASDAFIRWPFIFEGAFVGLLGAAAALAIIALVSGPVSDFMYGFFRVLPIELGSLQSDMVLLVVGTGFGWASSGRGSRAELPDQVGRVTRTDDALANPRCTLSARRPGFWVAPIPSTKHVHDCTRPRTRSLDPRPTNMPRSPTPIRTLSPPTPSLRPARRLAGESRHCRGARGRRRPRRAALFLSGYMLGTRTATTPGTPAADAALFTRSGHVGLDHPELRRSGGPEDDRRRRHQRDDQGARRPYSAYMSRPPSRARVTPWRASSRGSAPP